MKQEAIEYNGFRLKFIPKRGAIPQLEKYDPVFPQVERPLTEEEMLCSVLERKHNMIVERVDTRDIPQIEEDQLKKYFLPEYLETAGTAVKALTQHLRSWTIMPRYSTDHKTGIEVIRPWREQMRQRYGETFVDVWRRNKVRPNGLQPAYGYLSTIPAYIRLTGKDNQPIANLINEIAKKAKELMKTNSESSYARSSNNTKLKRIKEFDGLVIDTLKIINGELPDEYRKRYNQLVREAQEQAANKQDEDPDPMMELRR